VTLAERVDPNDPLGLSKLPRAWLPVVRAQVSLWTNRMWDSGPHAALMKLADRKGLAPGQVAEAMFDLAGEGGEHARFPPEPGVVAERAELLARKSRPAIAAPDSCRPASAEERATQLRNRARIRAAVDAMARRHHRSFVPGE